MDNDTKLINLALDSGEIMLKNGAETFRVQDTMKRILSTTGRDKIEAQALSTLLMVTLPREEKGPLSMMRGIHSRTVNFHKVCAVNNMSRAFVSGQISLDNALAQVEAIRNESAYHPFLHIAGYGIIAGGFSYLTVPSILDGFLAFLVGMLLGVLDLWLDSKKVPYFFGPFLGGVVAAQCACWIHPLFPTSHIHNIIIGSIMPLLPGVTFSKSMRDLLEGNLISGYTKAVEALVVACSLAGGVGMTLSYFV
ncbi:threonine/serine exporter family protein [Anaerotignum sp.]|nr:threonine/serine exporter family protein [Anaerotignum sp.]MBQ7757798.1 threonine/serine exporter family protein [Anaerotignum sp.]